MLLLILLMINWVATQKVTTTLLTTSNLLGKLSVDSNGNLLVCDITYGVLKMIYTNGTIVDIGERYSTFSGITHGVFDQNNNIYVTDTSDHIKVIDSYGNISIIAPPNSFSGSLMDLCFGPDGSLYTVETFGNRVWKLSPDFLNATSYSGINSPDSIACHSNSSIYVVTHDGSLYIMDQSNQFILLRPTFLNSAIDIDMYGNLYIGSNRGLERIDNDGTLVKINGSGIQYTNGIAIYRNGIVYESGATSQAGTTYKVVKHQWLTTSILIRN